MASKQGTEGVEGTDELIGEAASSVASVLKNDQPAVRPGAVQVPCGVQGTGNVVAAVDEHSGDIHQAVHVGQDLALF